MDAVALRAENIIKAAAEPCIPGEKIKAQKKRAYDRLRLIQCDAGDAILHNSWNRRAGPGQLAQLEEQCRRVGFDVDRELQNQLLRTMEAMRAADEDFYAPAIEALGAVVSARGGLVSRKG